MVDRPNKPTAIPVGSSTAVPAPQVDISSDNSSVTATLPSGDSVTVLLFGATVTSWKSAGGKKENLWLSEKAILDGSKPVRGGIPLVFPVFGPPPSDHATSSLPQHGFARNSRWEFLGKSTSESAGKGSAGDDSVTLDFGLGSSNLSDSAKQAWPFNFGLVYSVTLVKDVLTTNMTVRNEGTKPFECQVLFHSYLKVDDIANTTVSGLDSIEYVDKVNGASTQTETNKAVTLTGETDRVYKALKPEAKVVVKENGKPLYEVGRDNLDDVVVWNPWAEKAGGMGDFAPKDGYKQMICIESGAVSGWQKLDGGDSFEGAQIIKSVL
ncbi:aldose-1-epimerase [Xylona heveae TC161]|uniref:Glucose-6-phosphate 1-epimerase n=1 Tax=Xylona heveae (strain CBS 132557 / TC161) TaxID=1328760 RepID=A0A165JFF1_XYLHT|nr:aldose-1-epimerase [Xylona heveae TC161]KZF26165.1 aldose-1-epimerase [Xylona heveae TC161]